MFQFVKQNGLNASYRNTPNVNLFPGEIILGIGNQPTSVLSRWRKPGDMTAIQRFSTNGRLGENKYFVSNSDVVDASFVRLKNASLSYQFPKNWISTIKLRDCRAFIQGQNLLTITKYTGLDPEVRSQSIPPLRIVTIGVQIGI